MGMVSCQSEQMLETSRKIKLNEPSDSDSNEDEAA